MICRYFVTYKLYAYPHRDFTKTNNDYYANCFTPSLLITLAFSSPSEWINDEMSLYQSTATKNSENIYFRVTTSETENEQRYANKKQSECVFGQMYRPAHVCWARNIGVCVIVITIVSFAILVGRNFYSSTEIVAPMLIACFF